MKLKMLFLISMFILPLLCFGDDFSHKDQLSHYTPSEDFHPLYEQRRNRLLGIHTTMHKIKHDKMLNAIYPKEHISNEEIPNFTIITGYLPNHRFLFNFEDSFKKNGFAYKTFNIGYIFTPGIPGMPRWKLLLGANAGMVLGRFEERNPIIGNGSLDKFKYKGLIYGVKLGGIYRITHGELEFGIQKRRLNFDSEDNGLFINDTPSFTTLSIDRTSNTGLFFGYNFLF
ncbi:MAG: hypothetical protein K2I63_02255 [Helicobacter sp.]|nr:hypothetical protein [Helicobacter sp.]